MAKSRLPVYICIVLFLCVFLLFTQLRNNVEGFQDTLQYEVCFLCVCPTKPTIDFAIEVSRRYKTYIICDTISCETPLDTPITFIKISDEECEKTGWTKSNIAIRKIPSAWDKALYYFSVKNKNPSHVWFIEEDVFILRAELIHELNIKHPSADLITSFNTSKAEDPQWQWWYDADNILNPPLYHSMVCACRLSRKLMNKIEELVNTKKRLVFLEIMFNTLAVQNNMNIVVSENLSNIKPPGHGYEWNSDNIDIYHMYHPVKDVNLHTKFREHL